MKKTLLHGIAALCVAVLALPFRADAQKLKGQVVTTNGVAFSATSAAFKTVASITKYLPGLTYDVKTGYANNTDIGLGPKFSLGAAYYRQSTEADFTGYIRTRQDSFGTSVKDTVFGNFHGKLVRQNFGIRILGHFGKKDKLDWYYGLRLSYSIWSLETNATDWELAQKDFVIFSWKGSHDEATGYDTYTLKFPAVPQFIFGFRYFPLPFTATTFEMGIGAPYYFQTGVSMAVGGGTWINWLKKLKEKHSGGGNGGNGGGNGGGTGGGNGQWRFN